MKKKEKIIIKDIVIVCLGVLFILQTFWTIQRQEKLNVLENKKMILEQEIKHYNSSLNKFQLENKIEAKKRIELEQENALMLEEHNQFLKIIDQYEEYINERVPSIHNDSFAEYFAKYKYNSTEGAMGGNPERIRERKSESDVNRDVERSLSSSRCD